MNRSLLTLVLFGLGLLVFVVMGCRKTTSKPASVQTKPQPSRLAPLASKAPARSRTTSPKAVQAQQTSPAPRRLKKKRPAPPRKVVVKDKWYKPTYRERWFRPPRVKKLKVLPYVNPVKPIPWNYGSRKIRRVALTFDACSWRSRSRFDRKIAQILVRTKTPATLFVGGKWILEHKREAKWLAKYPFFEFANHTYLHSHLTRVRTARLIRELRWTQEIIYTHLGVIPTLFRPPYFESNKKVVRVAAKLGLRTILGDLPSGDPNPKFTKRIMTGHVLKEAKNGSIVVMHMNKGGHYTAVALPGIIRGLKRKGFKLVKVSTILGVKPYQTPED
ncbi:MAG: hypothetical protein EP343_16950 [Deltaproteobacteria bacterium]|nr:MAG: hypothetical protein EP343_16950 [Deltaproteobacteria bacterium]